MGVRRPVDNTNSYAACSAVRRRQFSPFRRTNNALVRPLERENPFPKQLAAFVGYFLGITPRLLSLAADFSEPSKHIFWPLRFVRATLLYSTMSSYHVPQYLKGLWVKQ